MTLFSVFIIIPLLSLNQVFASPVLLWSNANLPQSPVPLSTLTSLQVISNYICKLDSEQIQLRLFAVNDLTNEDIQRGSQSNHPILLDAQKAQSQFRFIPNVAADDVYKTFSMISQSNNMQCSHIHFQDASSSITTYETVHDALNAIQTSIDSIETNSNTVVVMALINGPVTTVRQTSTRRRRDIEVTEEEIIISDDRTCMFYADKLYWAGDKNKKPSDENYTLALDDSSCKTDVNASATILELHWNNGTSDTIKMTLYANITGRYWYLEKAVIGDTEYRYFAYGMHSKMDTPPKYSYVCTTATFINYNASTKYGTYDFRDKFFITNFQFQPFYGNGSYFGPPNYCTSFFTSGIWMGITSSLLCLGILLFGVTRMMNIKSNNRLDDAKSKPLIIKAQE
ncbi:unnamed protein product [Adineta steineri]|uniref:V-type proton ATPase subunit S1 n=1 Tax=Adineta steineri TaxID=433720 RepID=A0A813N4C2_9BILA|nr:unnamed protein product [Adineta steineri]